MTAAPSNKDDAAIQPVCQAILGSDRGQLFSSQYVLAVERVCSMGECFIGAKLGVDRNHQQQATGLKPGMDELSTMLAIAVALWDARSCL